MPDPSSRGRVALARAWALALPTVIGLLAASCSDSVGPTAPTGPVPEGSKPPISAAAASTGSLRIITSTTGIDLDPNGYAAIVDNGTHYPIDLKDTVVVTGLTPGTHSVSMDNVSLNCRGNTQLTRSVSIQAGATTTVTYSFTCTALTIATGTIQVVTSTTGSNLDPDGYTYSVDSAAVRSIGINTTVTVGKFKLGNHSVLLGGVASNCTISGSNPRVVNVTENTTVQAVFSVTCSGNGGTGSITASVPTTGQNLDPNGYTLTVDGGSGQHADVNASTTFSALSPGNHSVQLTTSTVANNCSVNGPNPKIVSVTGGQTTQVSFPIVCNMALNNQILFLSTRDAGSTAEIYFMNPDGSNIKRLTNNTRDDQDTAVSPDGTKIVFSRQEGTPKLFHLYTMNSDGSNQVRITNGSFNDTDPEWNPDGTKLAFESDRDGSPNVFIMNSDGTGVTQITTDNNENGDVDWSPDGSKIVYESHPPGITSAVMIMNANGTGITNLTGTAGGGNPNWSVDGTQIVFQSMRTGNADVWIMNADGTNQHRITTSGASDAEPVESQDGNRIAYENNSVGNYEIYTITTAGTGITRLTNNSKLDVTPEWTRPPSALLAARVVPWSGVAPSVTAATTSRATARAQLCRTQPQAAACQVRVIEPDWYKLR
jgi:Tol biopolymer transport system component